MAEEQGYSMNAKHGAVEKRWAEIVTDQPGVFVPVTMLATPVQAGIGEAVKFVVWRNFRTHVLYSFKRSPSWQP